MAVLWSASHRPLRRRCSCCCRCSWRAGRVSQFAAEQQAYEATIRALVQAVETKDHYTRGHSERVATASVMIARVLGMREDRVNALRYAGMLHDVGKLGVPTKILQKTGGLTDDEFAAIQRTRCAARRCCRTSSSSTRPSRGSSTTTSASTAWATRWACAATEIPEFARVIAVADAFDSMTSTRSYRGARTVEEAVGELERCKGTQFDPVMVDALVQALHREPWVATAPRAAEDETDALPRRSTTTTRPSTCVAGRERDR